VGYLRDLRAAEHAGELLTELTRYRSLITQTLAECAALAGITRQGVSQHSPEKSSSLPTNNALLMDAGIQILGTKRDVVQGQLECGRSESGVAVSWGLVAR